MTAQELQAALHELYPSHTNHGSRVRFAARIKTGTSSVTKWCTGTHKVPGVVDVVVELLQAEAK